jgi:glutamate N-acetyltransferase/amino-acid N-acetyltransferase
MIHTTPLPGGFRAGALRCGIRKNKTKDDLGLLLADEAHPAFAIYTRNQLTGAHVTLCREHLRAANGRVRAVLVNSGNANCATGEEGVRDARAVCARLAEIVGCPVEQVLFLSTGVIGARLPVERIVEALPDLHRATFPQGADDFARAIMTTDTFAKVETLAAQGPHGEPFQVTGMAKGAGMIHPDMATMFGFLLTDARTHKDLNFLLRGVADRSFHRVTIDGDTSPNDTVLLWTSERVRWQVPPADVAESDPVETGLVKVAQALCRKIASDGEGATRMITVQVKGASSEAEAAHVGRTIATSPLTKTAVHGLDPNWGRILSAAGRCGVPFDIARARVWIGTADLFSGGEPHPENEPEAHRHMRDHKGVLLGVDLGKGPFEAEVWTCDYSADYVKINAEYRT